MSYEVLMGIVAMLVVVLGRLIIPFLKRKGLWAIAVFGVHIIEAVCNFLELQGYGGKKYDFVKKLLLTISPKLTEEQLATLIEKVVASMQQLGKKKSCI